MWDSYVTDSDSFSQIEIFGACLRQSKVRIENLIGLTRSENTRWGSGYVRVKLGIHNQTLFARSVSVSVPRDNPRIRHFEYRSQAC